MKVGLADAGGQARWQLRSGLWAPLWLLTALIAIFQTGFMPLYSTRALGVAWEMWNSGQFLIPYSNGEPYSHKVPLLFWLVHLGWAAGGVGDVWPRLLEVGLGFGVLLLARRLARVLFRDMPLVAQLTPWLLAAFSYAFLFGLQIMYEVLLALCVLASLNALVGRDPEQRPWFFAFALAVAAGLMSKGPVMLLHVLFPFLLGPLWHPWAQRWRMRWYLGGGIAVIAACAVLLGWAIAAGMAGGEAYRNELFFMQTAGRVVDSFDHARPWWWYATVLPALLLPWLLWPRAWQALGRALDLRRHPGVRLLACWLPPVLFGFSVVSGKQTYYLLPELGGIAILLAAGFARLVHHRQRPRRLVGPWPLAFGMFGVAIALLTLPHWLAAGLFDASALVDLSLASPWFAVAAVALGGLLLLTPRNDAAALRHISALAMLGACLAYVLFANTFWVQFDLRPAAARIAALQAADVPVAHFRGYENQFQYLGRLTRPLDIVRDDTLQSWSDAHPQGRIIHYESTLTSEDLGYAELVQPFRSTWLIIEPVAQWIARRQGHPPPPPATPAERFPADYWPYQRLSGKAAAPAVEATAPADVPAAP